MGITEEDAKRKWCPLARSIFVDNSGVPTSNAAFNRAGGLNNVNCKASECMAWRWLDNNEDPACGFCGAFGDPVF